MIEIMTETPIKLKQKIDECINEIFDWYIDKDGDYVKTKHKYDNIAWIRAILEDDCIKFGIIGGKYEKMKKNIYSEYLTDFCKLLLNMLDDDFEELKITSQKTEDIDKFI